MVDERWRTNSWEEKAQENPLNAVMTTPEMQARGGPDDFDPDLLETFFAKGRKEFERNIRDLLSPQTGLVVDYGCGAGRILRAVADAGYRCAGIDIAPTMIRHARRFVPEADLHVLDEHGRSALPAACADVVYSYAVVQHIARLSEFTAAVDEMCRVLAPGGTLAVQVSTEDFTASELDNPARTENFETYSIHHPHSGPSYRSEQGSWGGVAIGHHLFLEMLGARGVTVDHWRRHKAKRPKTIWYIGRKTG